jgi:hypothetical protein
MRSTRIPVAAAIEWIVAALVVLACAAGVRTLVTEVGTATRIMPVIADHGGPLPAPPATVPPRVVSLSLLALGAGGEVRVGDPASKLRTVLRSAAPHSETVEHTRLGDRITRAYDTGGLRFILVLERRQEDAEPRVAGIYLE